MISQENIWKVRISAYQLLKESIKISKWLANNIKWTSKMIFLSILNNNLPPFIILTSIENWWFDAPFS